jgi:hypothetical protein
MPETTDIEKKSLEAHVELCAERYTLLEHKIATVHKDVADLTTVVQEVHEIVHKMAEKRNDQLIAWGLAVIGALVSMVAWLLTHYVFV